PADKIFVIAFPESITCPNDAIRVLLSWGLGIKRIIASVTTPNVPSEPTINLVKSYPVTFLTVFPPVRIISPVGVTTSNPITYSFVVPYFKPFGPLEFSTIFTQIVDTWKLLGSGG